MFTESWTHEKKVFYEKMIILIKYKLYDSMIAKLI